MTKKVDVTRGVKSLIVETLDLHVTAKKWGDPGSGHEYRELWRHVSDDWFRALCCECALCGLDALKLSNVAEADGGLERIKKMPLLEFEVEFEQEGKKEAA